MELKAAKRGGILDLQWIFKTGERLLSEAEVDRLMRASAGQMVLPDEGVLVLDGNAARLAREWRDFSESKKGVPNSMPAYMLFSLYQESTLDLELSAELQSWRKQVLEGEELQLPEEIRTSAGNAVLRRYQRRGVSWLWSLCDLGVHSLLADEMGLGKTLQILTLISKRKGGADAPSLIVCPASVVPVWLDQARQFYPELNLEILNGEGFDAEKKGVIWVASYGQLRRNRAVLADVEFQYAVLDEAQMIKNPDSLAAQACYAIKAKHRLVLTGTPLENRMLDVWLIFNFLMPGLLGSRRAFEQLHAEGEVRNLRAQIAPFVLRRTKDEVARDLPEKLEIELPCPLTETQRVQYAKICAEGLERLGDDVDEKMKGKRFLLFLFFMPSYL